MLYDVLPPLLLFISFGGIIVVVSRVVLRMRQLQFSQDIEAAVQSQAPIHEESLLRPEKAGVKIVKNRLAHTMTSARGGVVAMVRGMGNAVTSLRSRRAQRKELKAGVAEGVTPSASQEEAVEKKIQQPEAGLQDRISVLAQKGREGLTSLKSEIAQRIPDMQKIKESIPRRSVAQEEPASQKSSPVIRLVRHEAVEEKNPKQEEVKKGIVSQMLGRNTSKEQGAVAQAEDALASGQFDRVEDILVPYIVKHSSDTNAYMLLGKAAIGKEAWDEAMEIFQQVIKMDNSIVDAYAELGHAALNAGKFTLAIQSLQHARDMDAGNIKIREELLVIARRMDNKVVEKGVLEELEELREKA